MTLVSNSDPVLTAIAAYLAGDLEGVQAAYKRVTDLMDHLYEGIAMPSSECSPCYEGSDDSTVIEPTLLAA